MAEGEVERDPREARRWRLALFRLATLWGVVVLLEGYGEQAGLRPPRTTMIAFVTFLEWLALRSDKKDDDRIRVGAWVVWVAALVLIGL